MQNASNSTYEQTGTPLSAGTGLYQRILNSKPSAVRETAGYAYTERHLQCIWADEKLRPAKLATIRGEPVTVLNPGRWNSEAGPDFLDALLQIGPDRRRIKGDVEIHVAPADWNNHGHAGAPAYRGVIAHVTYFTPQKPLATLPTGTVEIALQKELASNPAFAFESIDLTAYPYTPLPLRSRPCAAVIQSMQPEEIEAMLESAGEHRLLTKAARIKQSIIANGADTALCTEIFAALGYKHNAAPFRALAQRISPATLAAMTPQDAYALLLGVAGLMPAKLSPRPDDETKLFFRLIWNSWWRQQQEWQNRILPAKSWKLSSIRPQNHPMRRLAAAAAFACHRQPPTARIRQLAAQLGKTPQPRECVAAVSALFQAPAPIDYWQRHISPASPRRDKPLAIVGPARAAAIYTNVILPFLATDGLDISKPARNLPPEQNNTVIRHTAYALLGPDHNPVIYSKNGLRQQGLMQIFHDFCLPDRSACRNCPFPAALQQAVS